MKRKVHFQLGLPELDYISPKQSSLEVLNKWITAVAMVILKLSMGSILSFVLICVVFFYFNVLKESYRLLKMEHDWSKVIRIWAYV